MEKSDKYFEVLSQMRDKISDAEFTRIEDHVQSFFCNANDHRKKIENLKKKTHNSKENLKSRLYRITTVITDMKYVNAANNSNTVRFNSIVEQINAIEDRQILLRIRFDGFIKHIEGSIEEKNAQLNFNRSKLQEDLTQLKEKFDENCRQLIEEKANLYRQHENVIWLRDAFEKVHQENEFISKEYQNLYEDIAKQENFHHESMQEMIVDNDNQLDAIFTELQLCYKKYAENKTKLDEAQEQKKTLRQKLGEFDVKEKVSMNEIQSLRNVYNNLLKIKEAKQAKIEQLNADKENVKILQSELDQLNEKNNDLRVKTDDMRIIEETRKINTEMLVAERKKLLDERNAIAKDVERKQLTLNQIKIDYLALQERNLTLESENIQLEKTNTNLLKQRKVKIQKKSLRDDFSSSYDDSISGSVASGTSFANDPVAYRSQPLQQSRDIQTRGVQLFDSDESSF